MNYKKKYVRYENTSDMYKYNNTQLLFLLIFIFFSYLTL